MYAHLNVNYLKLDKLPEFNKGWQTIIDALDNGKFFSSTGEVLIPQFTINNKSTSDTVIVSNQNAAIFFSVNWTFPLQFAETISGDGNKVYRHRIILDATLSFGQKTYHLKLNLAGRKWARLEVWDVAANRAFTQTVWLK